MEQDFSPEPEKITFTGADFIDPLHGWVVGFHHVFAASEGVIFHTSDGGDTWERQSPNNNLWDVQFIDALRGYAVGFDYIGAQGPRVFRTQDGGAAWEKALLRRHEMDGAYAIAVFEDRAYVLGDNDFQGVSTGPGASTSRHGERSVYPGLYQHPLQVRRRLLCQSAKGLGSWQPQLPA